MASRVIMQSVDRLGLYTDPGTGANSMDIQASFLLIDTSGRVLNLDVVTRVSFTATMAQMGTALTTAAVAAAAAAGYTVARSEVMLTSYAWGV